VVESCDVIFASLPYGLSEKIAEKCDKLGKAFIDLGSDFRLDSGEDYEKWYGCKYNIGSLHEKSVYGMPEFNPPEERTNKKIDKAAKKFYHAVAAGRPKPGLMSMAMFMTAQPPIRKIPQECFDHRYWKEHGWLAGSRYYFTDAKISPVKKALARIVVASIMFYLKRTLFAEAGKKTPVKADIIGGVQGDGSNV
jgi:hypothetical protein